MTQPGEEFEEFAAARWPEVEAVALVATLEPGAARELATATFATLRSRWQQALEDGAPTAAVRRILLDRVGRSGASGPAARLRVPGRAAAHPPPGSTTGPDPALREAVADPGSAVGPHLFDALAAEPAGVRAVGAAVVLWTLPDGGLDPLLPTRGVTLADVAAARGRLLEAHRRGRAADGLAPADERFDGDLADLLHRVAATTSEAPAPADLGRGSGGVGRRVLLGAAGTAVVGAATAWAVTRGPATAPGAAPSAAPTVGPLDRVWDRTTTWPTRGSLAGDPRMAAVLRADADGGAKRNLVYAEDVEGLRVVIATGSVDESDLPGILLWTGPAGSAVEELVQVSLDPPMLYGMTEVFDVAAVAASHPRGALVVVLGRPTATEARVSGYVRPTLGGEVERDWTDLVLEGGVGTVLLPDGVGAAARIRCADADGPLPQGLREGPWYEDADDPTAALARQVEATTGIPADRLALETTTYDLPDGITLFGGRQDDASVLVATATTPDGAVVRSSTVRSAGSHDDMGWVGGGPYVVPADREDEVLVQSVWGGDSQSFVVVAPERAVTVELRDAGGARRGDRHRLRGRTAVLRLDPQDDDGTTVVHVADGHGRTVYDGPPEVGTFLFDLFGGF